jgi:hypothetical protein
MAKAEKITKVWITDPCFIAGDSYEVGEVYEHPEGENIMDVVSANRGTIDPEIGELLAKALAEKRAKVAAPAKVDAKT